MGIKAVGDVKNALDAGVSARPEMVAGVIGDNPFSEAIRRFAEAIGRMQSGGAISKDEEKRFIALMPKWNDSREMQEQKLLNIQELLENRLQNIQGNYNFSSPQGTSIQTAPVQQTGVTANGFDVSGLSDAELDRMIAEAAKGR
jgi:hypothetical protein